VKFTLDQVHAHQKKHGFACPGILPMKPGIIVDALAPNQYKFKEPKPRMNKVETELCRMLQERFFRVDFEGIRLRMAPAVFYTPDFYCSKGHNASPITFYECKGPFIRPDAWQKLKLAAIMFPEFTFIMAQKKDGVWKETVIEKKTGIE
jgi:hypothetical protein